MNVINHEYLNTYDTCPDAEQSSFGSGHPHDVADGPIDDSFKPVAPAELLDTDGVDEVGFPHSLYIL